MQEEDFIITLTDENGVDEDYVVLAVFPLDEKDYVAFQPMNNSDDCFLCRYHTDGDGNPQIAEIEDDDEYEKVCQAFEDFIEMADDDEDEEVN